MTDEEYKGIYAILNGIKEDVNELKLKYTHNSSTLEGLSRDMKKLSNDHDGLRTVMYEGNYGRHSLLEELQHCQVKINDLDSKLETARGDISELENRWIKVLWAGSISVALILISATATVLVKNASSLELPSAIEKRDS